jgi:hypothetical protein
MGTRSVTTFIDENQEICRIYRQFDGYPEGHGLELARHCDRKITNGISAGATWRQGEDIKSYRKRDAIAKKAYAKTHANGIGELAALVLCELKKENPVGNVYLEAPGGEICDWVEYIYVVRQIDDRVQIDIRTQSGPFPFNLKDDDFIGSYSPKDLIRAYNEKEKVA